MNEIAQQSRGFGTVAPIQNAPLALQQADPFTRLRDWAELYLNVAEAAKHLANTDFVPDAMKGKPETVAAAMMKGTELGVDPLDALQNITVIKGKVGFAAEFMRRRIIEAGHEIRFKESTDSRCVIQGRRQGEDEWQQVTFTAENAKTAGIDIKAYPADKLVARASSRLCRRVFPEVLSGSLIIEDILDGEVITGVIDPATAQAIEAPAPDNGDATPAIQRKPRKAAARKATPKARVNTPDEDAPELPGDEPSDSGAKEDTEQVKEVGQNSQGHEKATTPQVQKLNILLQKEGFGSDALGRGQKLAWLSENLKREISSSNDLSKAEAHDLIDFLEDAQSKDAQK